MITKLQSLRLNKFFFIFYLIVVGTSACKKSSEAKYLFTGTITDEYTGQPIKNANVSLYKIELNGNSFNNKSELIMSVATDVDGAYSLEASLAAVVEFSIEVDKAGYDQVEKKFNPDNLSKSEVNIVDFSLLGKGTVTFNIKNKFPENTQDNIELFMQAESCNGCQHEPYLSLDGMNVDTSVSAIIPAGSVLNYQYNFIKSNTLFQEDDSVVVEVGDELFVNIEY